MRDMDTKALDEMINAQNPIYGNQVESIQKDDPKEYK